MIVLPKEKIKIWCEFCKGTGVFLKDSKYLECKKCSSKGYLEKDIVEFLILNEEKV